MSEPETSEASPKGEPETKPETKPERTPSGAAKRLTPAAERALAEAAARRAERGSQAVQPGRELPNRDGPEPTRYGDWENKGLASDF